MIRRILCLAMLGWLVAAGAQAATLTSYTSEVAFIAAIPSYVSQPLLPGVPGPVTITGSLVAGPLTISARDGELAFDGVVVSTALDGDQLIIDFATPRLGFGFTGGVVDELFSYIAGVLDIEVTGVGTSSLTGVAGSASFVGLLSDQAFDQIKISVASFDGDASSVAFVGLSGSASLVTPIAPAMPLLATALVLAAAVRRRGVPAATTA